MVVRKMWYMQINSVVNSQISQHQQNSKEKSVDALTTSKSKNQEPSFFKKLFMHPSLIVVPLFPASCYDIYSLFQEKSIKKHIKDPLIKETKLKKFNKTAFKTRLALFLTAIPLYFITDYINKKGRDRNFAKANKQIEDFNKQNGTTLKLIPRGKNVPNTELASFDPLSAQVLLTEKVPGDILYANIKQKYIINHELIHAKQHILMACSENGINKMNYIAVKRISRKLDDKKKQAILIAYQNINEVKNDDYKNKTIKINNYQINYVDYITALYRILYDKSSTSNNVPIIINKDFYEKAKAANATLTPDEKDKAEAYLEAYANYPEKVDFIQSLNPNSDYHRNLLEKEASKAIPWYINMLMNALCFF